MKLTTEFPGLPRGIFTISIDLELAWGIWDLPMTPVRSAAILREREAIDRLLELLERFSIRATWAIVAHLLLDDWRSDSEGRPHPDFPRLEGAGNDHFFQLSQGRDRSWWGRDVVEAVTAVKPDQEIGSHSFCHLLYDEVHAHPAAVEYDASRARAIHSEHGLPFESFVYPRNVVGFKTVLRDAGIRVFRDVTPRWYAAIRPRPLARGARLLSHLLQGTPQTVTPRIDTGMVALGDSMLLLGRNGLRRLIPAGVMRRAARRGLESAARRNEVFHLWFHPSNLVSRMEEQLETLKVIFEKWRCLAEEGVMENWVMGEFAEYLDREQRPGGGIS